MTGEPPSRFSASVRTGLVGEWIAIAALTLKGYRLLERRHGGKGGEIDLIMLRGRTVAFIEVKARREMSDAQGAITPAKIGFIRRRIGLWRAQNGWAQDHVLRADAVFIAPGRWPRHVENVFELPMT